MKIMPFHHNHAYFFCMNQDKLRHFPRNGQLQQQTAPNMPLRDRIHFRRPLYEFDQFAQGMPDHYSEPINCHPSQSYYRPARMLYEEGLEYEQCQNLSVAAERFYEDILTPTSMTNEDPWKKTPMSVGLPTPPSTPEKSSQRIRNTKVVEASILTMNYNNNFYHSPVHQSPNSNLQVVPEGITSDDVQDIIPFLTDLGNRSMASPNFFDNAVSQGQCNSQTKRSPPPAESIAQSPTYHTEHVSVCGFHDTEQNFSQSNGIYADCTSEGSYPVTNYREIHSDSQRSSLPTCVSNMRETAVPECMLSPVSPTKPVKRPYSAISTMPSPVSRSHAVRKLDFLEEITHNGAAMGHNSGTLAHNGGTLGHNGSSLGHNGVTQSMGQVSHDVGTIVPSVGTRSLALQQNDQYIRQMSMNSVDKFRKVEDIEKNGESELSRATHNVLERQRRNDLKMRFHILRDNLPDLMNNEKAPKIQILKKAYEFTQELKAQEQRLLADKELERQRKFILIRRLHTLRQGFF